MASNRPESLWCLVNRSALGLLPTEMGGLNALINAEMSVSGLRKVIESSNLDDIGRFIAYDVKVVNW